MNERTIKIIDSLFAAFFSILFSVSVIILIMACYTFSDEIIQTIESVFSQVESFCLATDSKIGAFFDDDYGPTTLCGVNEDERILYSIRNNDTTMLSERELYLYAVVKKFADENSDKANSEIAKAANDYVCKNTEYAHHLVGNNQPNDDSQTSFGCLVLGQTVCAGYTRGVNLLCNAASETIDATYVRGNVLDEDRGSHAWSMVCLEDGNYYHMDCTWNDTDDENGWNYDYFLKSDQFFSETRTWERWMYHECPASVILY